MDTRTHYKKRGVFRKASRIGKLSTWYPEKIYYNSMNPEITTYNTLLSPQDQDLCDFLAQHIDRELPASESKIWHRHPAWFLQGNPIVGYSKQKKGIRLMFWSSADFNEESLPVLGAKFKDASVFFNHIDEINLEALTRWIQKSVTIQWDYKNIVKRKGRLERIS